MPRKYLYIPQVLIITQSVFNRANAELRADDPGNPGQSFEEYVNMQAETLADEIPGAVVGNIEILPTSTELIAIIHYKI